MHISFILKFFFILLNKWPEAIIWLKNSLTSNKFEFLLRRKIRYLYQTVIVGTFLCSTFVYPWRKKHKVGNYNKILTLEENTNYLIMTRKTGERERQRLTVGGWPLADLTSPRSTLCLGPWTPGAHCLGCEDSWGWRSKYFWIINYNSLNTFTFSVVMNWT